MNPSHQDINVRLYLRHSSPFPAQRFASEELDKDLFRQEDLPEDWVKIDGLTSDETEALSLFYEQDCRGLVVHEPSVSPSLFLEVEHHRMNRCVELLPDAHRVRGPLCSWWKKFTQTPTAWTFRDSVMSFDVGRPRIMGIVNVTPDSFSDGGQFASTEQAVGHALKLIEAGAEIIDIGGESTRPGAALISVEEECARILPVIQGLVSQIKVPISIDTSKADVAKAAVDAGAEVVNDISCMRFDPALPTTIADLGVYGIVMHSRHTPAKMQQSPGYEALWDELLGELQTGTAKLMDAGVPMERIGVDPGIGFGKRLQDNYRILRELPVLRGFGMPIVVGASRKSFLGAIVGQPASQRLEGSLAAAAVSSWQGAHMVRVHDVAETQRLLDIMAAIQWPPFQKK